PSGCRRTRWRRGCAWTSGLSGYGFGYKLQSILSLRSALLSPKRIRVGHKDPSLGADLLHHVVEPSEVCCAQHVALAIRPGRGRPVRLVDHRSCKLFLHRAEKSLAESLVQLVLRESGLALQCGIGHAEQGMVLRIGALAPVLLHLDLVRPRHRQLVEEGVQVRRYQRAAWMVLVQDESGGHG